MPASDTLPEEQLALLGENSRLQLRRRLTSATAAAACALSTALWAFELYKGRPDPFELFALPALAVASGALALLLRTRLAASAEVLMVLMGACALLERFHFTLQGGDPLLERVVNAYEILAWFPTVYLFAFVVMPKRRAVVLSCGLLFASAALLGTGGDGPAARLARLDVAEVYLANLACIGFVFLLSSLRERYAETHDAAVALRRFAETDYLTGLANRRHLSHELEQAIAHAERVGEPLCVILFDIDRFKRINDRFGHEAGDRVLQRVSKIAEASLRGRDLLGRWGGEEFLIVLPGMETEPAVGVAERIRRVLDAQATVGTPRATASFGVSRLREGDDPDSLVRRADEALLDAKIGGRNQVLTVETAV